MLLRLIDDVTDQLKPGLLVMIDYCQAFDRISKDFMIHTFKKIGFGPDFVKWVSVLMADAKSCVAYCGWLSKYFAVEAGIRQGCPFSPLAFVLAVELLGIKTRQCENIKGLNYWKARNGLLESIIKIALYADNLTLFLKDEHDMQQALKILAEFSTFSGLEINRMKSEAMWLGSKQNTDTFFGFVWKRRLKILGVYFACDKCASQVEENWTGRVENIKRIINAWEKRNLSIAGKVCIIKTFLISQFVHIMQALVVPYPVLTQVNRILFRFLWRKRDCNHKAFEKVKRTVVCGALENGGLNMIDLKQMQAVFLLQWVGRLFQAQVLDKWSHVPKNIFAPFGDKY